LATEAREGSLAKTTALAVDSGDVLATECDVLVLKYAQGPHGVDQAIVVALGLRDQVQSRLSVGRHVLIPTSGRLPAKSVLYVGVPKLPDFGYAEIREGQRDHGVRQRRSYAGT
jgi:hypothetical protein